MKNNRIYYPKLSNIDLGWVRIGGPGLANCMFFVAKAYINYLNDTSNNKTFISPTWRKFSLGPIIRKERDKRVYSSLFKKDGVSGLKKFWYLILMKSHGAQIQIFDSLGNYFTDILPYRDVISNYFLSIVNRKTLNFNPKELGGKIAIHVRLGDYNADQRIPLVWYKNLILNILKVNPNQEFALFSDGSDEELSELLEIKNITRHFYGNAFADMFAISLCKLIIASDSTFSAWGAFLGGIPLIFNRRHFPEVFQDKTKEFVLKDSFEFPKELEYLII